tara:strand:- start:1286 stop:2110 length:825 start_codon:yes stop_codon:yes gene_type:complete
MSWILRLFGIEKNNEDLKKEIKKEIELERKSALLKVIASSDASDEEIEQTLSSYMSSISTMAMDQVRIWDNIHRVIDEMSKLDSKLDLDKISKRIDVIEEIANRCDKAISEHFVGEIEALSTAIDKHWGKTKSNSDALNNLEKREQQTTDALKNEIAKNEKLCADIAVELNNMKVSLAELMTQDSHEDEETITPPADDVSYTVRLHGYDLNEKVDMIKLVRDITGLSPKEAKDLLDSLPVTLKEDVTEEERTSIEVLIETAYDISDLLIEFIEN